jgi:hypothetical protein
VIQFTELSINDQLVPITTDPIGAEGGKGGAAKTVGAGLSLLAGGNHIQIPEGTIAEISLKQPLTVHK